jgi:hypothetical protein
MFTDWLNRAIDSNNEQNSYTFEPRILDITPERADQAHTSKDEEHNDPFVLELFPH